MSDDEHADAIENYKLCGFLRAVLSVASSREQCQDLPTGTPCFLFAEGPNVGFVTEEGVELLPIPAGNAASELDRSLDASKNLGGCCGPARKRRRRGVEACMSVVHQLHTLIASRCLKIQARVLRISFGECGEGRALVLVDVFMPTEVWCGWQFPKFGVVAASLFKHVRKSLLVPCRINHDYPDLDIEGIWKISDCHVLGCEIHQATGCDGRKFDLHEIFKSLPSAGRDERGFSTRIISENQYASPGIWDLADDVLCKVLSLLHPKDLVRVTATCHHLKSLASTIMPCMKLKLFPHQEAAVEWMLKRERRPDFLFHPLCMSFSTVDGFCFYVNAVSGEISTGIAPMINDFRGGMFCDEPGLGKTITALSLILKTHGTLAEPPDGVVIRWCMQKSNKKCGYYEVGPDNLTTTCLESSWKRFIYRNGQSRNVCSSKLSSDIGSPKVTRPFVRKRGRSVQHGISVASEVSIKSESLSCKSAYFTRLKCAVRSTRSLSRIRRDLLNSYEINGSVDCIGNSIENVNSNADTSNDTRTHLTDQHVLKISSSTKNPKRNNVPDYNETWVQCDACRKWRKLVDRCNLDTTGAWFCSMNDDPLHQSCSVPEESWDCKRRITDLPGFHTKGSKPGNEDNISFFSSVLKEHHILLNLETKKALTWLANLSQSKLLEMETVGITRAELDLSIIAGTPSVAYHEIFRAFGLIGKVQKTSNSLVLSKGP
ncbi:hypothetical protein HPP92_001016 [Vanilla planifolia]|uniref:CW-type domain-containing protein n=1 Tax=Vanilla planifolia TaxID=51239 RepID=A0A835RPX8_VANPL|nr:hypothetical protein HPP92_001016 [Vanilla planifolia]